MNNLPTQSAPAAPRVNAPTAVRTPQGRPATPGFTQTANWRGQHQAGVNPETDNSTVGKLYNAAYSNLGNLLLYRAAFGNKGGAAPGAAPGAASGLGAPKTGGSSKRSITVNRPLGAGPQPTAAIGPGSAPKIMGAIEAGARPMPPPPGTPRPLPSAPGTPRTTFDPKNPGMASPVLTGPTVATGARGPVPFAEPSKHKSVRRPAGMNMGRASRLQLPPNQQHLV